MHGTLNIDENKKLITQFACKSRDKSFKLSYSMIGQCLSNENESATLSKSKNFLNLNKAEIETTYNSVPFLWCLNDMIGRTIV